MTDDRTLFSAIAAGDLQAAETLVQRFSAPLFRYCRLNFTDHFRAGEFVEMLLALWINRIRRGDIGLPSITDLFEEAFRMSSAQWRGRRGKGLSGKQRRILEVLEDIPLLDRLALDLVLLEHHDAGVVAQWLGMDVPAVSRSIEEFLNTLSKDEKIGELLKHAAFHQSQRKRAGPPGAKPRSHEREKPERAAESSGPRRTQTRSEGISTGKTGSLSTGPGKTGPGRTGHERENTGGDAADECHTPDEKHRESRPRRRRVDPRELDVDI
jgi:hypothetical protein